MTRESAAARRGVTWFGHNTTAGWCQCCQRAAPVYMGYNGGQPMAVTFCARCKAPGHLDCDDRAALPGTPPS